MKGLIENKVPITEPLAKNQLSGYGLGCLGGFIDKGKAQFYPCIGGEIQYDVERMTGAVTLLHANKINSGSSYLGRWRQQVATLKQRIQQEITKKLLKVVNLNGEKVKVKDITTVAIIISQFDFNKIVDNQIFAITAREIYNKFPKNAVEDDERYWIYTFIHKDRVESAGKLKDGFEYYINHPKKVNTNVTRIRVNKSVWLEWRLMQGFKHKEAIEEWCRLYYTYGSNGEISSKEAVHSILDEISNRPTLTEVPDLASLITDKVMTIALWNLTSNGLKMEEWLDEVEYTMIMPSTSDKAASATIKIVTDEWNLPQVIVPNSDMPAKTVRKILPFWDGTVYDERLLAEPYLGLTEVNFKTSSDSMLSTDKREKLQIVHLRTLNACSDGGSNPNYLMLNRLIGPVSSLPGDGKVSQISLTAVYPWILGVQEPEQGNMTLERRHWPLVYHYTKFDAPPVASENFMESDLIGLKSFLGNNFYLFKPEEFINQEAGIEAILNDTPDNPKASTIFASIYDQVKIK